MSDRNLCALHLLPGPLRRHLEGRHILQKILTNTSWLAADRVIRMLVGLIVSVWIARYLGPADFGLLNYVMAFVGLFSAIASMGLQNIVVRDLVRRPEERQAILASAFALKLVGAAVAISSVSMAIFLVRPGDIEAWMLVTILGFALLPQASEVVEYHYQSLVNARPIVIIRNVAFLISSLIKVSIILNHGSVILIAMAFSAEAFFVAVALAAIAGRREPLFRLRDATRKESCRLLREGWPLILSGLSIAIYMRIDQVMLGQMLDIKAVGVFSAAVRISEAWYFVPVAVMASVAPVLTALQQQSAELYERQFVKVMRLLVWGAIFVALAVTFLASEIIGLLYDIEYMGAAKILVVHVWAGVFVSFGLAGGQWLTNAGLIKYSLYQTLVGALANIFANMLLIPSYGIMGAAISTIVSYGTSAVFFNAVLLKSRPLFMMQLRAII